MSRGKVGVHGTGNPWYHTVSDRVLIEVPSCAQPAWERCWLNILREDGLAGRTCVAGGRFASDRRPNPRTSGFCRLERLHVRLADRRPGPGGLRRAGRWARGAGGAQGEQQAAGARAHGGVAACPGRWGRAAGSPENASAGADGSAGRRSPRRPGVSPRRAARAAYVPGPIDSSSITTGCAASSWRSGRCGRSRRTYTVIGCGPVTSRRYASKVPAGTVTVSTPVTR
jgi:hypothetical protein